MIVFVKNIYVKSEIKLRELPSFSKPRERAMEVGVSNLADYELLAIILGTGSKDLDVLDLAKQVLIEGGSLNCLLDLTISELKQFKGIGNAKAISILSALELGKRATLNISAKHQIKETKDIYLYAENILANEKQEILLAIFIDCKCNIVGKKIISIGTLNSTAFHLRDLIKWALKYSAFAMAICHNHPSGDATPSEEDFRATDDVILGCQAVDIRFLDHLIIGRNCYYSIVHHKCFKDLSFNN